MDDERAFLEAAIARHTKNLRKLELQASEYGVTSVPLHLSNSIEAEQRKIGGYNERLSQLKDKDGVSDTKQYEGIKTIKKEYKVFGITFFSLIITITAIVYVFYIGKRPIVSTFDYAIQITDDKSQGIIEGAKVTLTLPDGNAMIDYTDAMGKSHFLLSQSLAGENAHIYVEAQNYLPYSINSVITLNQSSTIRLTRIANEPSPTPEASPSTENTLQVVSVCNPQPRIVPPALDIDINRQEALIQIGVNYGAFVEGGCKGPFAIAPIVKEDGDRGIYMELYLSNEGSENIRAQVEDTFEVEVIAETLQSESSPAIARSAGSIGTLHNFPTVSLNTNAQSYRKTLEVIDTGQKIDFFSLEVGEFEGFTVSFQCDMPGIYRVHITIPYRFGAQQNQYIFNPQTIICPNKSSTWIVDGPIDQEVVKPEEFIDVYHHSVITWNGSGYDIDYSDQSPQPTP